ncbi:MAG: hypothetical protein GQF41_2528 [Candidatus Rifleibacterium amylolyticum]|nr:MAG: hypothetical protein GQF41_2528 [Candidatus Rifleibacterium amylolyticum]
MTNLFKLLIVFSFAIIATGSYAYDDSIARKYEKMFDNIKGEEVGKALNIVSPEAFVEEYKSGKQFFAVDIRTPAETSIFTLSLPDSMKIPLDQLFKKENLKKLPTDKQIILVCSSGMRSAAVLMALRDVGFSNVSVLKGGFKELSSYLEPKEANKAPKAKAQ